MRCTAGMDRKSGRLQTFVEATTSPCARNTKFLGAQGVNFSEKRPIGIGIWFRYIFCHRFKIIPYTLPCMVYLPTWMVDVYGKCTHNVYIYIPNMDPLGQCRWIHWSYRSETFYMDDLRLDFHLGVPLFAAHFPHIPWVNCISPTRNRQAMFWSPFSLTKNTWATKEKHTALLSIESWLFNRDAYHGLLWSPHNCVIWSIEIIWTSTFDFSNLILSWLACQVKFSYFHLRQFSFLLPKP